MSAADFSPAVTQLAQLNKHRAGVGTLTEVRECFTQTPDDRRALESEERVDVLLLSEGRNGDGGRLFVARLRQERGRQAVVGLAIESELEIACQVLVPRKHTRAVGQPGELGHEGVVERFRIAAVVTISGTGVEKGVTTE